MLFPSWELLRIAVAGPAGRRFASMLAIAVGVALGYAVQLVHSVAVAEMEQAARSLAGEADLVVQSAHGGMPESLYGMLALRSEVAAASPVIEIDARLPERREKLRLLGIDVFRAAQIQPALVARGLADPLDTLRSDRIFLNPAAAAWLGAEAGGEVVLQAGMEPVRLRVGGIIGLPG
ncbi:MAG: multidrug ABC transporter substrate-binding protein, partial [Rhodocyclaceae bacterium]|nr:multidrug ABC transporter substrate-binding protein [Rhodocyclaceae bacterium]